MVYKLIVEYDGKQFYGFQIQRNVPTVCGELESALSKIFQEKIKIVYAGRTDRFVSAKKQVASFVSNKIFNLKLLQGRLNMVLNDFVKVSKIYKAEENFMASRKIKLKTYEYLIFNGEYDYPIQKGRGVFVRKKLDASLMQRGANFLEGTHDFTSFCSAECEKEMKTRMLYEIKIRRVGNFIKIKVVGNGFLQHMVRIIVGTLILVGHKTIEPAKIDEIIKAKDRRHAGKTVDARGLTLVDVQYF